MSDVFKQLANRFCTWPLPAEVCADVCATNPNYRYRRSGTHLLTVSQAEQMLRYVLSGEPTEMQATVLEFGNEVVFAAIGLETEPQGTNAVFEIELRDRQYKVTVAPSTKDFHNQERQP